MNILVAEGFYENSHRIGGCITIFMIMIFRQFRGHTGFK